MHIAAAHHPPTTRRHYPAGQRMKGVVDRLFARQNPGAMSLSRPAPARRIWPSPSREAASEPDRAVASSPPSISSISSRPRARAGRQGRHRRLSHAPRLRRSSTNSAICRSPRPAGSCCSTCQPALRAHLDHRHHQSRLRRMAERVRQLDAFMMPLSWTGWCVGLCSEHGGLVWG